MNGLPRVRIDGFLVLLAASAGLLYLALRSAPLMSIGLVVVALLLLGGMLVLLTLSIYGARYQAPLQAESLGQVFFLVLFGFALVIAGHSLRSVGLSLLVGLGSGFLIDQVLRIWNHDLSRRTIVPLVLALAVLITPPIVPVQVLSAFRVAGFLFLAGILLHSYTLMSGQAEPVAASRYFYYTLVFILLAYLVFSQGAQQVYAWSCVVLAVVLPSIGAYAARDWLMPMIMAARKEAGRMPRVATPAWLGWLQLALVRLRGEPAGEQRELPATWRDLVRWSTARGRAIDQLGIRIQPLLGAMSSAQSRKLDLPEDFPKHLLLYLMMSLSGQVGSAILYEVPSNGFADLDDEYDSLDGDVHISFQATQFQNALAQFVADPNFRQDTWPDRMGLSGGLLEAEEFALLLRRLRKRGRYFELVDLAQIYLAHFPESPRRMQIESELAHGEFLQVSEHGWAEPATAEIEQPLRPNPDRLQLRVVNRTTSFSRLSGVECRVLIRRETFVSMDLAAGEGIVLPVDQQRCDIVICPYDWTLAPIQVEWRDAAGQISSHSVALKPASAVSKLARASTKESVHEARNSRN